MSWGTRRRNTIVFLVFLFLLLPILIGGFVVFYNPPSCFDGKKNGGEIGVDCGGKCELLCTVETLPPIVIWERFFEVSPGVYNVVAYVENQNPGAGIRNAKYTFKLFNRDGVLIADKKGSVRLHPKSVLPVIEVNLKTIKQIPSTVSFEFTDDLVFEREEPLPTSIIIKNENYFIDSNTNTPKVTAEVQNITFDDVEDVDVVVLLYDVFNNVVTSSSTYIEKIKSEESKNITFTWPNTFKEDVSRIEIVPIYEPVF